jgi:hypothetical protein
VNVDYVQSVDAGQVELHVQDGPLDTYRDDAVHWRRDKYQQYLRATNPHVTVRLGMPLLSEGQLMFTWPH